MLSYVPRRTAKQAENDRRAIERIGKNEERKEHRKKLATLAETLKGLRAERSKRLAEAREHCAATFAEKKAEADAEYKRAVEAAREARKATKKAARAGCAAERAEVRADIKERVAETEATAAARKAERRERQQSERFVRERDEALKPRVSAIERLQESDDSVEKNLEPSEVPVWRRVKRTIRGTDRKTRYEAFREWWHDNEDVAQQIQVEEGEKELDRMLKGYELTPTPEKKPRKKPRPKPREVQQQFTERWAGAPLVGEHGAQRPLRPVNRKRQKTADPFKGKADPFKTGETPF